MIRRKDTRDASTVCFPLRKNSAKRRQGYRRWSAQGENLRPAGEGVYALVLHGNHTHLAYVLELPPAPGEVQSEFNIQPEGRFVIAVKNPGEVSPPGVGLEEDRQPDFSADCALGSAIAAGRRWIRRNS